MTWAVAHAEGAVLSVRVTPRAARDGVAGELGDALRVRLRAPPVEGQANRALVEFLARMLGLRVREVVLLGGAAGRAKRVLVRGLSAAEARQRLLDAAAPKKT